MPVCYSIPARPRFRRIRSAFPGPDARPANHLRTGTPYSPALPTDPDPRWIMPMSSPELAAPASSPSEAENVAGLRSDFMSAIGWMGLGIAILIGSVTMDRLEKQGINPYTIPGLLPGLLGCAMAILGALLALRSWRPHLLASTAKGAPADRAEQKRLLLVLGLCLT